jgi:hypothetical protein
MKRQTKRQKRSRSRKTKRQRRRFLFSRRKVYKGGADLPVPEGSVVGVDLDPKDDYSVPVLISKSKYENEILED